MPRKQSTSAKASDSDRLARTPLHYAAADGNADEIAQLLASGVDVNRQGNDGWTPLHFAAQSRSEEATRLLLEAGARTDIQDSHGNTALFRAVFSSQGEGGVISLLRSYRADPKAKNKYGVSPLELAGAIANYAIARYFNDVADVQ